MDIPSSAFIVWSPDELDANLISEQFNFKVISSKGEVFFLLYLIDNTQITAEELSDKFNIDIQNIIPLRSENWTKLNQNFFITGFSQDFLKFNEFKALLQQISPNIQVFDNISAIEANIEKCEENDITILSIFLPALYPSLSFTSDLPKKTIRLFIENNKSRSYSVTNYDIKSLFNWENMISQIYFNPGKTIADVVLNEEGEKNFKIIIQQKVVSYNGYIFDICKYANLQKINKFKSLELIAEFFPSDFTIEMAYELFSNNYHIYRIQLVNKDNQKKSVIIQFTSQRSYRMLLNQGTIRYHSDSISIKPVFQNENNNDPLSNEKQTKLNRYDAENHNSDSTDEIETKNNAQKVKKFKTIHFIGDNSDDDTCIANSENNNIENPQSSEEKSNINDENNEEDGDKSNNKPNLLLHATRFFVSDNDSEDEEIKQENSNDTEKISIRERNVSFSNEINNQDSPKSRHYISDDDEEVVLFCKTDTESYSSFVSEEQTLTSNNSVDKNNSYLNRSTILKGVSGSDSTNQSNPSKFKRLYIEDVDDGNDDDILKMNFRKNTTQNNVKQRRFLVLESSIDDFGLDGSYSDSYKEFGSYSDSENDH